MQLDGFGRRAHLVEDEREVLALPRRLALDLQELSRVRHRVEDDHQLRRQLQREESPLAGRKLDRVEGELLDHPIEVVRKIDRRTPEYLPKVLPQRKLVRRMRLDPAPPPIDQKGHLDDLVQDRLVTGSTPGAVVLLSI